MTKKCVKCGRDKPVDCFCNSKRHKDGKNTECKECRKKYLSVYNTINRDRKLASQKRYRERHREKLVEKNRAYKSKDKKRWRIYGREYERERRVADIGYRLKKVLRSRIQSAIKSEGIKKNTKSGKLLGCTMAEFKKYISSMFSENMSWDNYGSYWNLDHIVPCASFDLTSVEQQKICFHYTNYQPLTVQENSFKRAKVNYQYRKAI